MNKYFTICLMITLTSCNKLFYEVFEVNSTNVLNDDNEFSFEDQNLKISYNLWQNRGTVAFKLYNKSSKPIFIDWNKSNLILNNYSFDYWSDVEITKGNSNTDSYVYKNIGIATTSMVTIKEKNKPNIQIPPNSYIFVNRFNLNQPPFSFDKKEFPKGYNVKEIIYSKEKTILTFRNYIAYSFDKELTTLNYIDNDFWVEKIILARKKPFFKFYVNPSGKYPSSGKNNRFYNKLAVIDEILTPVAIISFLIPMVMLSLIINN